MEDKIDIKSLNIRNKRLQELRLKFPDIFNEGKIDEKKLFSFFVNEKNEITEKYSFEWAGKYQSFKEIQKQTTDTLTPDKKNSINFDQTSNIFIEGENLSTLKVLQKSYYGKVKMIYADPPYNTGNDSFVYPDDYTETKEEYMLRTKEKNDSGFINKQMLFKLNAKENGQYHSVWLSMMYPRLYLARNLLKEDGVIFISIDDNEVANLKLLMNEVFGEENFIGMITVVGNPRGRDYGGIAKMHDYILVYGKSSSTELNNLQEINKEFDYEDANGGFDIIELRNRNIAFNSLNRPNLYYPFYINTKKELDNGFFEISLDKKKDWFELFPKESQGFKTVWRWGKDKANENLNISIVGKAMQDGGFQIVQKYRDNTKMARSMWSDKEVNTEKGTLEVKNLFKKKIFSFPKPVGLVKRCIEMGTASENDIVLDFFAGSGTTAQATMELNRESGSTRNFILIQMPEICEKESEAKKAGYKYISDITKERIKLSINKIEKEDQNQLNFDKSDIDLGFKSFQLHASNFKIWEGDKTGKELKNQLELHKDPLESDKDEDILYEIVLKSGVSLSEKIEKIIINKSFLYHIPSAKMIIILDKINETIIKKVKEFNPSFFICLNKLFEKNDQLKTNTKLQLKDSEIEFRTI